MNNDLLDIELLEDYLEGKLDSKTMHKIEKQALEDPFVAQALAGLSESPRRAAASVSLLQKQLYERIAEQQVTKKETVFTWQRLSVAAAAAVMFISVSVIFFMREKQNREQIAKNQPRSVEVNMAPAAEKVIDSAKNEAYATTIPAPVADVLKTGKVNPKIESQSEPVADAVVQTYAMRKAVTQAADTVSKTAGAAAAATVPAAAMSKVASAQIATVKPAVSTPVDGWANFDIYITDHNKFGKDAKAGKFVELSFVIDSEGKPADIKVEKSATAEFDAEAVRLIKEGPKWEQPKSAERISYTVGF